VETVSIVPLVDDERHVGVLVSAFRRTRTFGDRDTQLQDALARMATQALTRLRLREELEQLALYDPLTGLAHRPLFLERLRDAVTASRTDDRPMALIFVDLDGFKAINDNRGHGAGDLVLSEMGRRLSSAVRRDDLVARFGGDEFVILCRDADPAAVHRVADRLLAAIREPLPDPSMVVTGSMGIALMRGSDDEEVTAEVLLETADEAMYRSKRSGRDRATIVVAASTGAD
jgi:diguanylate cyclase (GGDEF)-like protein